MIHGSTKYSTRGAAIFNDTPVLLEYKKNGAPLSLHDLSIENHRYKTPSHTNKSQTLKKTFFGLFFKKKGKIADCKENQYGFESNRLGGRYPAVEMRGYL